MPVAVCPNCRVELDLDAEDLGHRMECPACLGTFVPRLRETPPDRPPPPPTDDAPDQIIVPADDRSTVPGAAPLEPPAPPPPPVKPTSARPASRTPQPPPPTRHLNGPLTLACPACRGEVSVDARDLGHRVECPMCRRVFRADHPDAPPPDDRRRRSRYRDEDDSWDERPRRRSRYDDDNPYESANPKAWVWQARRDLGSPGGALEVLGWLDVVFGGLYILMGVLMGTAVGAGGGGPGAVTWEVVAMTVGLGVSGIVMGGVKAFGGRLMRQVQNHRLGVVACVAGCLPIYLLATLLSTFGQQYFFVCCPAVLTFPAYIVSIVFGIMGLVKLLNRNVKKAFEANRPGGDIDAV